MSHTKYVDHPAATQAAKDRIMAVMREVGNAPLDDLAEYLERTESNVKVGAEALVEEGKLSVLPGKVGPNGHKREYVLTCPVCSGPVNDPLPEPPEVTGEGQAGDLCTHPFHDPISDPPESP